MSMYRLIFVIALWCVSLGTPAEAATLSLVPSQASIAVGDTVAIEVRIDSGATSFNAAQATLAFPGNLLKVESVDASPDASAFNFWLEKPHVSEKGGSISFVGGATNGIVGSKVGILTITFKALAPGSASIIPSHSAITASDGSGTNILETAKISTITIAPGTSAPSAALPAVELPAIHTVSRPAIASGKPAPTPSISVPLYNDPLAWSPNSTPFLVVWSLPQDVTKVAATVDQNPSGEPEHSEGLFDWKRFDATGDGVWYAHVQFKNDVGWGKVAHYRIAVDTTPPVPFAIAVNQTDPTDPSPTLLFQSADALSGVSEYVVFVDGTVLRVPEGEKSTTLPPLALGAHAVTVRASDAAGNVRDATTTISVEALASPTITSMAPVVFLGEQDLTCDGNASIGESAHIVVRTSRDEIVAETDVPIQFGAFHAVITRPLVKGTYTLTAEVRDAHGARSYPTEPKFFEVRERPILTIGGIGITEFWFFVSLITLIIGASVAGWYAQYFASLRSHERLVMAERDIQVVFGVLARDIATLRSSLEASKTKKGAWKDSDALLAKMAEDIERGDRSLREDLERLS